MADGCCNPQRDMYDDSRRSHDGTVVVRLEQELCMGVEHIEDGLQDVIDAVYRSESRRVLATLIRLLGDFDAVEEALHATFRAAAGQWPRDGIPCPGYLFHPDR